MHRPPARDAFRPELQGLRAVAVALVVAFHLWPDQLRGGYVGVDVFFVVSGFLITSHLVRELVDTGRLDLPRFWGRRIRRLLPAGLLVLALSAVGVLLLAPASAWHATGRQVAASALYVQNWVLAGDAVDYLAQDQPPTVAQHYWSLSVEEQLYAFWPLLLLLLVTVPARLRRASGSEQAVRRALSLGLVLVCVASLAWSVHATGQEQATAYFSTLTRVWEFGAGALAAVVLPRRTSASRVVGWAGLLAVVGSAALLTEASAFPGWVALVPVLGTVALLRAGAPGGRSTVGWWLARRPLTFLGDLSYSVYLVHWPLLVLLPWWVGHDLGTPERLLVLVLTVALAWLSTTFVENPLRQGRVLTAARWRPYAFAATGMAALVLANVALQGELDRREARAADQTAARLAAALPCRGPDALANAERCRPVAGDGPLVTPPDVVAAQGRQWLVQECQQGAEGVAPTGCRVGRLTGARLRVAVVGDSHGTHWVPLLKALGEQQGWEVLVMTKSACPATDASRYVATETSAERRLRCDRFNDAVDRALLADRSVTDVFVSGMFSAYTWSARPGAPLDDPAVDGFARRFARWSAAGKRVHVIRDIPLTRGELVPDCLVRHRGRPEACAVPRAQALPADPAVAAARRVGVDVVDLSDQFCDARLCYAQVGDVIAYRDRTHVSFEYSRLLAPYLARQLDPPLLQR